MNWDENNGAPTFSGEIPLHMSSHLALGEHIVLRKSDVAYEIVLTNVSAFELQGAVHRITPTPAPQNNSANVLVGDTVLFKKCHIFTVYRK